MIASLCQELPISRGLPQLVVKLVEASASTPIVPAHARVTSGNDGVAETGENGSAREGAAERRVEAVEQPAGRPEG